MQASGIVLTFQLAFNTAPQVLHLTQTHHFRRQHIHGISSPLQALADVVHYQQIFTPVLAILQQPLRQSLSLLVFGVISHGARQSFRQQLTPLA
ncbi:hypothetical protein D3C85_1366810 [compost metagenome]